MNTDTVEDILLLYDQDFSARKSEFFRYYNSKRIQHQLKQLDMLRDVPSSRLTEIGSYLGFATGLFLAAGFKVQTIDAGPEKALGELVPEKHIQKNILDITVSDLSDQEVIVCCETLEHIEFYDVEKALSTFSASNAEWLLISVPYRCMSIDIRFSRNIFSSFFSWIIKFPNKRMRHFTPHPEPYGHKWELGFKGYPLEKLTNAVENVGFSIERTDYVGSVQSVFILGHRR